VTWACRYEADHGYQAVGDGADVDVVAVAAFGEASGTTGPHMEACSAGQAFLDSSNQAIPVQASAAAFGVAC
jgi:hypothetical protein